MRVLVVSMFPFESNTSATIQNKGIVRGLADLKCKVDVLTLKPMTDSVSFDDSMNDIGENVENRFYFEPDERYKALMAKKSDFDDQASSNRSRFHRVVRGVRPLIKRIYAGLHIVDAQRANVNRVDRVKGIDYSVYDIILSVSDPKSSHLIVRRIRKMNPEVRAKWIQYWGDPMFHDITRTEDWRDGLVRWYEQRLIAIADRVVYASPLTLAVQKQTFADHADKMDYANQVYVTKKDSPEIVTKERGSLVRVGYFGAYYSSVRDIMPTYRAAIGANFELTICGGTDLSLSSIQNIEVMNRVPYRESVVLEEQSDILLCLCNIRGTQVPGKIYYYTGYQKPIVVVLDGDKKEELREYLESFNRFVLCENNEKSIREAIERAKTQLDTPYALVEELTPKYLARKILGDYYTEKGYE